MSGKYKTNQFTKLIREVQEQENRLTGKSITGVWLNSARMWRVVSITHAVVLFTTGGRQTSIPLRDVIYPQHVVDSWTRKSRRSYNSSIFFFNKSVLCFHLHWRSFGSKCARVYSVCLLLFDMHKKDNDSFSWIVICWCCGDRENMHVICMCVQNCS